MNFYTKNFVNADLTDGILSVTHNLNTEDIIPIWFDNNGVVRDIADAYTIVNNNSGTLAVNEEITGTHKLLVLYVSAPSSLLVKRLHELSLVTSLADDMRLAFGKAGTPTVNVTWLQLLTLLYETLNFLPNGDYSELQNPASLRNAIGAPASSQLTKYLLLSRVLGTGNVLSTNNTNSFTPSLAYHPATFKSVRNIGQVCVLAGTFTESDYPSGTPMEEADFFQVNDDYVKNTDSYVQAGIIGSGSASHVVVRHFKGDTNYTVDVQRLGIAGSESPYATFVEKFADNFIVYYAQADNTFACDFDFRMYIHEPLL